MRLDIPENEKKEILDGLLYLMPDEQEQFLAELEELARKLIPEIVGRILRLNLSKDQNEQLLAQLEYLSDQEQVEFVQEFETRPVWSCLGGKTSCPCRKNKGP